MPKEKIADVLDEMDVEDTVLEEGEIVEEAAVIAPKAKPEAVRPVPWQTWTRKPPTVLARPALRGETVGKATAQPGQWVVSENGSERLAAFADLEKDYLPPPPEVEPLSRWNIEFTSVDAVPFEWRNAAGIPDRGRIVAAFEKAHAARAEAEAFNAKNRNAQKKVPPYPEIPGVKAGYRAV